jgi:excinuclease UvrABC ATPase subunit
MSGSTQTISKNLNPFPGLRPFSSQESHLFFGREGQVDEIVNNLRKNRFVAVVGASGSGKSSLIYCGVIPSLVKKTAISATDWLIINTRPGNSPIPNLINDLNEVLSKSNTQ